MTLNRTAIQWTDWTANPIRFRSRITGRTLNHCVKVSSGCKHCYAERITVGWPGLHGREHAYAAEGTANVEPYLDREVLRVIANTRRTGRLFAADMTDLFGEWVPDEWLFECLDAFAQSSLIVQVLTKRAERMQSVVAAWLERDSDPSVGYHARPPANLWLGVSVEDQATADKRIPHLLQTPAAVRFVSCEPMLGPVNWSACSLALGVPLADGTRWVGSGSKLDWVIFGGESGKNARPCDVAWIRDGVRQCREAGVAAFVKQLGTRATDGELSAIEIVGAERGRLRPTDQPMTDDQARAILRATGRPERLARMVILRDSHGGDPTEWPEDLRCREFPA